MEELKRLTLRSSNNYPRSVFEDEDITKVRFDRLEYLSIEGINTYKRDHKTLLSSGIPYLDVRGSGGEKIDFSILEKETGLTTFLGGNGKNIERLFEFSPFLRKVELHLTNSEEIQKLCGILLNNVKVEDVTVKTNYDKLHSVYYIFGEVLSKKNGLKKLYIGSTCGDEENVSPDLEKAVRFFVSSFGSNTNNLEEYGTSLEIGLSRVIKYTGLKHLSVCAGYEWIMKSVQKYRMITMLLVTRGSSGSPIHRLPIEHIRMIKNFLY